MSFFLVAMSFVPFDRLHLPAFAFGTKYRHVVEKGILFAVTNEAMYRYKSPKSKSMLTGQVGCRQGWTRGDGQSRQCRGNVSPARSSTKKRAATTPALERLPKLPPSSKSPSSRPRRHVAQNAVACATACIVQPATWVLETPITDRVDKRKRAWSLSFHRVARRTNNMLAKFSIPTWSSSQPTPSPMTPFPCSDPGPRSRIPLAQWPISSQPSLSIACALLFTTPETTTRLEATLLCVSAQTRARPPFLAQTLHVGMVQHQINVPEIFSRHIPSPAPPPRTPQR